MKVAFLTEAGNKIGYGHLYRCIALAEACTEANIQVIFVVNEENHEIVKQYVPEIQLLSETDILTSLRLDYIVVDLYHKHLQRYNYLKQSSAVKKILIIDDIFSDHFPKYPFDIIIKMGFQEYQEKVEYKLISGLPVSVYSGADFLIFRKEFEKFQPIEVKEKVERVLISMGGSDPFGVTEQVLSVMNRVRDSLRLYVVIGAGMENKRMNGIFQLAEGSHHKISILYNVSNMAELISMQDFAIINGGNTRFELALLGVPFLSIAITESQSALATKLSAYGIGKNVGVYDVITPTHLFEEIVTFLTITLARENMSREMLRNVKNAGREGFINIISNFERLEFRAIKDQELNEVYNLHCRVVAKMLNKGIRQWLSPMPFEKLRGRQDKGENFGLFKNNELVVFLSLTKRYNYPEWSHLLKKSGTIWLNSVSGNVSNKTKGLGKLAILKAIQYLKEKKIEELYLDCVINDGFLVRYYQEIGFNILGETRADYRSGSFDIALMKIDL